MKLEFEPIQPTPGSSFTLLHYTQAQDRDILWHYHPEYELVYIPEGSGRRHIGQHFSRYSGGELVFMGPNLPHLSFSYEQQGAFEQIVLQLREDFLGENFLHRPELAAVQQLFHRSRQGLSFGPATRAAVGATLRQMLTQPAPVRLLTLLQLLYHLAEAPDATELHAALGVSGTQELEQQRLRQVYQHIEQHYAEPVTVQQLADLTALTVPAFCRFFKKMTGQTLTSFLQEYRISQARLLLLQGLPVTEVSLASGFNNLSHFNRTFRKLTGQSPTAYRQQQTA
ncbi:helix-turn-helix domain-containing protein [Hymenobacter sp. BT186]|uniref:Helix-turn-helix domain-containing protein n=1 Tax=Hymenobacter telluris TaxID=2816474 RepID=A0A939JD16_9BACT|nr:AraC family transcriptional regulator [Hymenobacter telluris]MBO0358438.1 helix-turn-helix domain-containing protein [Hymenobacter telluris]MBW3374464.1 AraC family transcriptional regulator [Hymenobacter norwichensis]